MASEGPQIPPMEQANAWIPHNTKDEDWFQKFFDIDEKTARPLYANKEATEFKYDESQNDSDISRIIMKNVSFKINGKKYNVGDFFCLSWNELFLMFRKRKEYNDKISYDIINGDISVMLSLESPVGELVPITENDVV